MTIETQLRDALTDHAETFDLASLAPMGDIAVTARKRTRRNRVLSGAGALVFAVLLAVGMGGFGRTDESGLTVVTEITGEEFELLGGQPLKPQIILADSDRFVGIAVVTLDAAADAVSSAVPVISDDGLTWRLADDKKTWRTSSVDMVEYDGTFHVLAVDNTNLVHATSTDFVTWDERVEALPSEVRGSGDDAVALGLPEIGVPGVSANESGIHAVLVTVPGAAETARSQLASLVDAGLSTRDFCESDSADGVVTYRVCGTTSTKSLTFEQRSLDFDDLIWNMMSSVAGEPFQLQPDADDLDLGLFESQSAATEPRVELDGDWSAERILFSASDGEALSRA